MSHCAWPAKHVDGVSLPSGRPARVGRRKLARPGGYGDAQCLRLETEQGKASSVHSGGTARLSADQCPLRGPRQQDSQPFFLCISRRNVLTQPSANPTYRQRPYCVEYTRSHPNSEVKRRKARSVLGWGTAWEALRVLLAFLYGLIRI